MAESSAPIGIIAKIQSLVEFSSEVLHHITRFHSTTAGIPKVFKEIKVELPLLGDILRKTKDEVNAGNVDDTVQDALLPVLEGCGEKLTQLEAIISKYPPEGKDERSKAISRSAQDSEIDNIQASLHRYIGILTFYYTGRPAYGMRDWHETSNPSLPPVRFM